MSLLLGRTRPTSDGMRADTAFRLVPSRGSRPDTPPRRRWSSLAACRRRGTACRESGKPRLTSIVERHPGRQLAHPRQLANGSESNALESLGEPTARSPATGRRPDHVSTAERRRDPPAREAVAGRLVPMSHCRSRSNARGRADRERCRRAIACRRGRDAAAAGVAGHHANLSARSAGERPSHWRGSCRTSEPRSEHAVARRASDNMQRRRMTSCSPPGRWRNRSIGSDAACATGRSASHRAEHPITAGLAAIEALPTSSTATPPS